MWRWSQVETLLKKRDLEAAQTALKPVLLENPKNSKALLLQRQIDEQAAKDAVAEPSLKAKFTKPVTLQFRDANLKMVFEALSRTSGINILLDKDVRPDLKTSIFVKDVSVEDTINLILLQNQLEKKVLSDNTVFIYPSTPAKLKDYQDLKIRSFHLTNADPKQMLTMLKTLLKTKDIFIHEKNQLHRDARHPGSDPAGGKNGRRPGHRRARGHAGSGSAGSEPLTRERTGHQVAQQFHSPRRPAPTRSGNCGPDRQMICWSPR